MHRLVIAIDGPAAAGKSTTARLVAEKLGYLYLDTGAMYRSMGLKVLREKIDLGNASRIAELAENTQIRLERADHGMTVLLDGEDVTAEIRRRSVTNAASKVSSIREVREVMVREQRKMSQDGGVVLEGRDIGTVVIPGADLKIFMIADVKERARRRQRELRSQNTEIDLETLQEEIHTRDRFDSEREVSPLRKADDAYILDTSGLTIDEQVEFIVNKARDIMSASSKGTPVAGHH